MAKEMGIQMNRSISAMLFAFTFAIPTSSIADIYKRVDKNGQIMYTAHSPNVKEILVCRPKPKPQRSASFQCAAMTLNDEMVVIDKNDDYIGKTGEYGGMKRLNLE